MSFEGLHETVVKDVIDIVKDGIEQAENLGFSVKNSNILSTSSSLSKATEGLILVFPHLCSTNASPETAQMLTKVIETKAVSILQIAFSAFNITNSTDAVDFVRQFHTNIGSGRMSVDTFIDAINSANESTNSLNGVDRSLVRSVLEEFKHMECYFEEDLSETSINDFKVVNRYGNYIITEAKPVSDFEREKLDLQAQDLALRRAAERRRQSERVAMKKKMSTERVAMKKKMSTERVAMKLKINMIEMY